ncbi:MAG TPA: branched-chain amino acid ABC transporter permease, partial [Acidimicrobiales bacterium]|nr:branched-chain amino acid ABC transporter permease [Acidimicrobiales bacterium]
MTALPRWARITAVLVAAAVLPPLLGRLDPGTFDGLQARVLGLGICMAAAALALNLVMGYAGQISLGHFALVGVGAFTAGVLTSPDRLGLPFAVALPAAVVMGAAIAFVVGLPALRLRGLYLAVVTIAFSYAMEQSIFRAQAITGGSSGVEVPRPIVGAFTFLRNADYLALLLVLIVLLWVVDVNVTRSKLGRAFQAIRADESVAASFGIDVARHKLLAFTISGAFAGVAG